jgi:hypothetical protein
MTLFAQSNLVSDAALNQRPGQCLGAKPVGG